MQSLKFEGVYAIYKYSMEFNSGAEELNIKVENTQNKLRYAQLINNKFIEER